MKKERKNEMKKMIAEFIISEYDNPKLKVIRDTDEKAFDKVVQKMRDGGVSINQNHRRRCRQGRENFEKNFLNDFHYTVKGPNITSSRYMKTEPIGDYNDITGMRNASMVRNAHKDLKPTDDKSKRDRIDLCPYKTVGFVSYFIDSIRVDFENGLERRSFVRILSILGSLCIEYARLANAAYGTKIDEKWAEEGLLKSDDIIQHRWNKKPTDCCKDEISMKNNANKSALLKDLELVDSKSKSIRRPYRVERIVIYFIGLINRELEDGCERRSFIRLINTLAVLCTEYAELANAAYGTKIDKHWAEEGLLKLGDVVQHRWNKEFRAPLKDDKQNQKAQ